MRILLVCCLALCGFVIAVRAEDRRHQELRNLNGYFPFQAVEDQAQWEQRRQEIRKRILVSQGLWPLPTKAKLNAVIHGRVERDDYVVDRVYFESVPGHFVTGSLYRPRGDAAARSLPAILSPHGHWKAGRFYDAGEVGGQNQVAIGAETNVTTARFLIQARAVQLARMGCLVFVYDMTGEADSVQIAHRPTKWSHLDRKADWGFMSVQADLRLQNMMGLQTWNSIRAIDFLLELPETDPSRIGVTGASGGGTQSMIIGAIDERIAAAMPCVMVSTAMQGGCTCENAPLLRINQGNVDIAAANAPRPLGLTAADDWTVELKTKGYPDLKRLYEMHGKPEHLSCFFHTQFKHNYNRVNRLEMYSFFNRHFALSVPEPIDELAFEPLNRDEATVWTAEHPAPSGEQIGDVHEVNLLKIATEDSSEKLQSLVPDHSEDASEFMRVVGGGWETILGRNFKAVGDVRFNVLSESSRLDHSMKAGTLDVFQHGEQVPMVALEPSEPRGAVIWVAAGKSVVTGTTLPSEVREHLENGFAVVAADLFQQEKAAGEEPDSQRMWYQRDGREGWHRFSGYTYGYNHCLFAQRTHDIMSLIKHAKSAYGDNVRLVGKGAEAGSLVLAATSQSADTVKEASVDLKGFRFADVSRHDHPMFVPGAVKYLDVDGLLALCAPTKLSVAGIDSEIAKRVYKSVDADDRLIETE